MNGEGKKTGRGHLPLYTYMLKETQIEKKKKNENNICSQLGKNSDFREIYSRITSGH